jgi:hypothetical protein
MAFFLPEGRIFLLQCSSLYYCKFYFGALPPQHLYMNPFIRKAHAVVEMQF